MVRALIAGGIMALVSPLIGIFLVSKRYSLMADTLSHVCLAGVAIGLLTKTYPVYSALIVAILSSIAIQKLNETQRVAFLMHRIDGKKYAEIAEELGISIKAVEKRIQIALQELRKEFDYFR